MAKVANKIHEIMDISQGKYDWQISAILLSIVKSEEKISYGGMRKHFDKHPGDLERWRCFGHMASHSINFAYLRLRQVYYGRSSHGLQETKQSAAPR